MILQDKLELMKETDRRNAERIATFNQRKRVKIDDVGLSVCECGAVLECDEFGDMPDTCPECGALLDYSELNN